MYYLKHLWQKMRYNNITRLIVDGLIKLGISINPCYLVLEGFDNGTFPHLENGLEEYEVVFLGPEDMKEIAHIPLRKISEEKLLQRLRDGNKCLGIKKDGELAAFTWFQLDMYTFCGEQITLKENEAYLFDAHTLLSFRGQGLAPYVRYQCYKELRKMGKTRLYSISVYFNRQSINFKKKLNARFLKLSLFISVFQKWRVKIPLKTYHEDL